MSYVNAYAWMFSTVLFILAIQQGTYSPTGLVSATTLSSNAGPWITAFTLLALTIAICYARYRYRHSSGVSPYH